MDPDSIDNAESTDSAMKAAANAADEATPTVPSAAALFGGAASARSSPPSSPPPPSPLPDADRSDPGVESEDSFDESGFTSLASGPPSTRADARSKIDMEQLIGGRVMAVVGGVIVILAGLFFAKLAYDNGWIGGIPAIVRALMLAGFGAGLLVAFFVAGQVSGSLLVDTWGLVGYPVRSISMLRLFALGLIVVGVVLALLIDSPVELPTQDPSSRVSES